jgi:arylsulfatase A-like enzyme
MVYQLDKQLKQFMRHVAKQVDVNNTLYVLTADHGIEPIPEILAQKGIPARRLPLTDWIPELNTLISDELSIPPLIYSKFYPPYLYFNQIIFNQLDQRQQDIAITLIKNYLMSKKGIKKVWSYEELDHASLHHESLEYFFRQQLYPGRSGTIIIQTDPYNQLGSHTTGTDHSTPYRPNTHVPLIIYQPGKYEYKTIDQKVWTLQLANTLAHILKVPRPSASTFEILPGIATGTKGSSDLE